jgi:regulator of CtrA degradation
MENMRLELTPLLLDSLYTEAMLLADEARHCFDRNHANGDLLPEISVAFSCESLKVTTRLMHSIAWLLNQKALRAGEISEEDAHSESNTLGYAPESDSTQAERFPPEARALIAASEELYVRLERFSGQMRISTAPVSEPRIMRERLMSSF